jgi:hypothetical protein
MDKIEVVIGIELEGQKLLLSEAAARALFDKLKSIFDKKETQYIPYNPNPYPYAPAPYPWISLPYIRVNPGTSDPIPYWTTTCTVKYPEEIIVNSVNTVAVWEGSNCLTSP